MAKKFECPSGKRRFKDHRQAVSALHKSATARVFAQADNNKTRRAEVRTYRCGMCNGHHLTSKAEWYGLAA